MKSVLIVLAIAAPVLGVSGCASRGETIGTVGGAAIGGVVGSAVTGGSTIGTVGGAAAGGIIGHEAGERYEERNRRR